MKAEGENEGKQGESGLESEQKVIILTLCRGTLRVWRVQDFRVPSFRIWVRGPLVHHS